MKNRKTNIWSFAGRSSNCLGLCAITFCLLSAGDALAQYSLGLMYDYGKGVTESDAEAIKWYRLTAEQGDSDAQLSLR